MQERTHKLYTLHATICKVFPNHDHAKNHHPLKHLDYFNHDTLYFWDQLSGRNHTHQRTPHQIIGQDKTGHSPSLFLQSTNTVPKSTNKQSQGLQHWIQSFLCG
jgi:hypothetical protein